MAAALFAGLGSGAVHAVSGPDHILSLAPLSIGREQGAWRVGLAWGLGHAAGTVAMALALILAAAAVDVRGAEVWGERIAGLALVALGLWGLRRRKSGSAQECQGSVPRSVALVGVVHGLTGAAALLLLLPAVVADSGAYRFVYLAAFAAGSTAAMALLTAAMARIGKRGARLAARLPVVASTGSVALGAAWLAL